MVNFALLELNIILSPIRLTNSADSVQVDFQIGIKPIRRELRSIGGVGGIQTVATLPVVGHAVVVGVLRWRGAFELRLSASVVTS